MDEDFWLNIDHACLLLEKDKTNNQVPAQDDVRDALDAVSRLCRAVGYLEVPSYDNRKEVGDKAMDDARLVMDFIKLRAATKPAESVRTNPSVPREVVEKIKELRDEHHESMIDYARMDNTRDSEIQEAKVSALDEALAMLTKEGADGR